MMSLALVFGFLKWLGGTQVGRIVGAIGIGVIMLVGFRYKYTEEGRAAERRDVENETQRVIAKSEEDARRNASLSDAQLDDRLRIAAR